MGLRMLSSQLQCVFIPNPVFVCHDGWWPQSAMTDLPELISNDLLIAWLAVRCERGASWRCSSLLRSAHSISSRFTWLACSVVRKSRLRRRPDGDALEIIERLRNGGMQEVRAIIDAIDNRMECRLSAIVRRPVLFTGDESPRMNRWRWVAEDE